MAQGLRGGVTPKMRDAAWDFPPRLAGGTAQAARFEGAMRQNRWSRMPGSRRLRAGACGVQDDGDRRSAAPTSTDFQGPLARIERMNAETRKSVEEGLKLSAEARKLARDATIAPYAAIFAAFTAGAAMVGAVVTVVKILGSCKILGS
ncbi:hypothetical protein [Methylobacterium tarhaniae]|uniref:hypothetical protein n=1 Tax=Methylobacterium tarhaniae TaxID=1187852 RepID=UPI003D043A9F